MNRTLISLAILKANWDVRKHDYIDNFVCLLGALLNRRKHEELKVETTKQEMLEEFGLDIPHYAMLTIMNRAAKRSLLNRENKLFYVNNQELPKYDREFAKADIERKFDCLCSAISSFGKNRYEIEPTREEIENAVIDFLKHYDLDILFAAKKNSVLPNLQSTIKLKHLISAFAIDASKNDLISYNMLVDLSIANALACSVLYSDTNTYTGKLRKLNLYIDTPLVMALLGFNGSFRQDAFIELLHTLQEENANLYILDTTKIETHNILTETFKSLDAGNIKWEHASTALRRCRDLGWTASDVEAKIVELDKLLSDFNIEECEVNTYLRDKAYQIDEDALKAKIVETYEKRGDNFVLTQRLESTIDRDVKVLSDVYRFRQGHRSRTLKECKELFVTSNTSLALASRLFELSENNDSTVIPSCLTDALVSTIIWIQSPQKVRSLNEKQFIANCYAYNEPSEQLVTRYLAEVEKMKSGGKITLDQYYLLRSHRVAMNLLEEKTLGDPDSINGETIDEIIFGIESAIKGKSAKELEEERQRHQDTKAILEQSEKTNRLISETISSKAQKVACVIGWILFGILTLIILIILGIAAFSECIAQPWGRSLTIGLGVVLTVLNLATGFNIWGVRTIVVKWLSLRINEWLIKK